MSDLRQSAYRFVQRAIHANQRPAIMGKGDTARTLHSSRDGFVWVRFQFPGDSSPTEVRLQGVAATYGTPVLVEQARDGVWETVTPDGTAIIEFKAGSSVNPGVGNHAANHQRFGPDPIRVHALQMQPLLTRPADTPGLSVYVEPYLYVDTNGDPAAWDGGLLDLTSKVPGSTGHQVVIITGLDRSTGALTTIDGTSVFVGASNVFHLPFDRADVATLLTSAATDFVPSGAVRLYNGQTRIDTWDLLPDCRPWFDGGGGAAGLALQPTVIDQEHIIPADFEAIWSTGFDITTGSLTIDGKAYIIE